jgi:hypothetical protein
MNILSRFDGVLKAFPSDVSAAPLPYWGAVSK